MADLGVLGRFAKPRGRTTAVPTGIVDRDERCELCRVAVPEEHRHVLDVARNELQCACRACAILFVGGAAGERMKLVPDRVLVDPDPAITAGDWVGLGVPVGLAFVVRRSATAQHVVLFPGPAGIVEGDTRPELGAALRAATPLARELVADTECLFIYTPRGESKVDCFLVPIDRAYAFAGKLRRSWRGIDGGDDAKRDVTTFLDDIRRHARRLP
jgi:hypothetical protein